MVESQATSAAIQSQTRLSTGGISGSAKGTLSKKLSVKEKISLVSSRSGMLPSAIFRTNWTGSQSTHQLSTLINSTNPISESKESATVGKSGQQLQQ